jgi:hypothetical protein
MARVLVTIGTDGLRDWVRLPEGQSFGLGTLSALKFIAELAPSWKSARTALDEFNAGREALLSVDADRMWELFASRRRRWAALSFMAFDPAEVQRLERCLFMQTNDQYTALRTAVLAAESALGALSQAANKTSLKTASVEVRAETLGEQLAAFTKAAKAIKVAEEEEEGQAEQAKEASVAEPGALNYDTFKANSSLAEGILQKLGAVNDRIDAIVASGKKGFNSARAKGDLGAVTTKVAGIMADVDLTQPWVADDLKKLAARAEHIHQLFFPKKG